MDQTTKAAAALKLMRHAVDVDDQHCFDLMAGVIEADKLYYAFADNEGNPIETMADFVADLEKDVSPKSNGIRASAGGGTRRLTPDERYAERQAANRAGR